MQGKSAFSRGIDGKSVLIKLYYIFLKRFPREVEIIMSNNN